jgi:hypothetical protein
MGHSRLLGIIVVLQGLILAGQWSGGVNYVQPAMAQISDPGAQRIEMIAQMKDTNEKLDKLVEILESGNLQVKVSMPDENKESAAGQ